MRSIFSTVVALGLAHSMVTAYPIQFQTSIAFPDDDLIPTTVPMEEETLPSHFVSTVQFAIHESSAGLTQRSKRVVMEELNQVVVRYPTIQSQQYEIRSNGDEVVFFVTSSEDMRDQMRQMVVAAVHDLEPQVKTIGRALFYRATLQAPEGGFLDVSVNEEPKPVRTIRSIRARSVPLRDVLNEMRDKLGGLSYVIPGDCGDQPVDLSIGQEPTEPTVRTVSFAMDRLGGRLNLKVEKNDTTYIFSGNCAHIPPQTLGMPRRQQLPEPVNPIAPSLPRRPRATQVVFPLPPIH